MLVIQNVFNRHQLEAERRFLRLLFPGHNFLKEQFEEVKEVLKNYTAIGIVWVFIGCWPGIGRVSAWYRPGIGPVSAQYRPGIGPVSAGYRPGIGPVSVLG